MNSRPDSENVLIIGAGTVARSLVEAYSAAFPKARFTLWNRTKSKAQATADSTGASVADDLEQAVRGADIITSATMVKNPILNGEWFQPGQHIDLIGAYRPDMREVDDNALQRARIFVDSYDTTVGHIGEIQVPLETGAISRDDLLAEVSRLAQENRFDYLLIESTGISEPIPVAQTFTFEDEDGVSLGDLARLDTMVTVVDAASFLRDYQDADSLEERGESLGEEDERTVTDLLIDQVEFADVIVLNKIDLAGEDAALEVEAILKALNPGKILSTS